MVTGKRTATLICMVVVAILANPETRLMAGADGKGTGKSGPNTRPASAEPVARKLRAENQRLRQEVAGIRAELAALSARLASLEKGDEPVVYQGKPAGFWLAQFKDRDPAFRAKALVALGSIAEVDKSVQPLVVAALKDRELTVRLQAVQVMGNIVRSNNHLLPSLVGALKDSTWDVVNAAVDEFQKIGPAASEAVPSLIGLVEKNPGMSPPFIGGSTTSKITNTLPVIDPTLKRSVPLLAKCLVSRHQGSRTNAAAILEWLPKEKVKARLKDNADALVPVLIAALKMSWPSGPPLSFGPNKQQILGLIADIGPPAHTTVPAIIRLLAEKADLANSLTAIDPKLTLSFPLVVDALGDTSPTVRQNGAYLAAALVGQGTVAVPKEMLAALGKNLKDREAGVRAAAVQALAVPQFAAGKQIPEIVALVQEEKNVEVLEVALSTLVQMKAKPATLVSLSTHLLKSDSGEIRALAVRRLSELGPAASPAMPLLKKALEDTVVKVRLGAVAALASIGPQARTAVPALVEALQDPEKEVRDAAKWALKAIDVKAASRAGVR